MKTPDHPDSTPLLTPTMAQDILEGCALLAGMVGKPDMLANAPEVPALRAIASGKTVCVPAPAPAAAAPEVTGLLRAAEILRQYADVIRDCKAAEIERFSYLPEVDEAAAAVERAARSRPAVPEAQEPVQVGELHVRSLGGGPGSARASLFARAHTLPFGNHPLYVHASPPLAVPDTGGGKNLGVGCDPQSPARSPSASRLDDSGSVRETLAKLRAEADSLYCRALGDAMKIDAYKGAESKMANGRFGLAELAAHRELSRRMARQEALHEACNAIEATLPNDKREAHANDERPTETPGRPESVVAVPEGLVQRARDFDEEWGTRLAGVGSLIRDLLAVIDREKPCQHRYLNPANKCMNCGAVIDPDQHKGE